MKPLNFSLLFLLLIAKLQAQELPRRAFLGIRMEAVTDDVQRVMKLPAVKGVLLQQVIGGSTAAAAGLQRGDVLLELDGQEINTPDEAVRIVGTYRAGQLLKYKFLRSGKTVVQETVIQGLPKETYNDLEVTYSFVNAGNAQLRTILTKPKHTSRKLPALLFIQGIELNAAEADTYIKRECACAAMLLNARMPREEAVKLDEVCGGVYDILLLRSDPYWRQLYDLNVPELWQTYTGKTLAAWGSADYISARREHELIAEAVNSSYPGNGTFLEIPNSNHGMFSAASFPEARTNPGPFNPAVALEISKWLTQQLNNG